MATPFRIDAARRAVARLTLGAARDLLDEHGVDLLAAVDAPGACADIRWEALRLTLARNGFLLGAVLARVCGVPAGRLRGDALTAAKAAFERELAVFAAGPFPPGPADASGDGAWTAEEAAESRRQYDREYMRVIEGRQHRPPANAWERLYEMVGIVGLAPWPYAWWEYERMWLGASRLAWSTTANLAATVRNLVGTADGRAVQPNDIHALAPPSVREVPRPGSRAEERERRREAAAMEGRIGGRGGHDGI